MVSANLTSITLTIKSIKMNDLYYSLCAMIFFILGIFVICVEIHEIKEDYKEYKKIHIYPWDIIFFIYGIIFFYICTICISKIIY